MSTISDLELQLSLAFEALRRKKVENKLSPDLEPLARLVPAEGLRISIRLCDNNLERKDIRGDASHQLWKVDENHYVEIQYSPIQNLEPVRIGMSEEERRLLEIVADAERQPKYNFVGLKRLRDNLLLESGLSCFSTEESRHHIIDSVIKKGFLKIGKVPNPQRPDFPVTSVSLNREHPEIAQIFKEKLRPQSDFAPIRIQGKALSETIREGRR